MDSPKLILIPSPLVLPFSYYFLKKKLRKKFQLIIPSLPHIALTFHRKLIWDEEDYALWLKEFMDKEGIDKSFILGHSNSGAIAIKFAELFPERVNGIIVADTIGVRNRNLLLTIGGRLIDAFYEWWLTLWGFWHLIWNLIFHAPNFIFQIYHATSANIMKASKKLKVPVLVLWGKNDHTIPLDFGKELSEVVKDADVYVSQSGSHDWIITHSDEASRAITKWTSEISSHH